MKDIALLVSADIVAGAMNAVAGGGTFVALPVLTLAGLLPTIANASITVALFPDTLVSGWAYRRNIGSRTLSTRLSCLVAERHWDQVGWAIAEYAWRFQPLIDEVL
jgi:uncharacterized membrane protein YfcA